MRRWNKLLWSILLVGVVVIGGWYIGRGANTERASLQKIYLPGVLDLTEDPRVLGWESDEITPEIFLNEVNTAREKAGVPILHPDEKLMEAAKMRAEVMLRTGRIDHQDPYEGLNLANILPKVGYRFLYASENISLSQGNASGIVNGFLNSPNHKVNLLDKNLVETGVGIVKGEVAGNRVVIVAHLFGVPVDDGAYRGSSVVNRVEIEREIARLERLTTDGNAREEPRRREREILEKIKDYMDPEIKFGQEQFDLLLEYQHLSGVNR